MTLYLHSTGVKTECTPAVDGLLVQAAKVIRDSTGSQMRSVTWETGTVLTLSCKPTIDQKHRTWTNNIRALNSVDQTRIDYVDKFGEQKQQIVVKCAGNDFVPDIFNGQDSWCEVGCAPIPEDYTNFWAPNYTQRSMGLASKGVPIAADADLEISVECKDGYSQKIGDVGEKNVFCTEFGWSPILLQLINCATGCRDLTEEIKNGVAIYTPGTVTFSIGERVSFRCDPNFKLDGKEVLTCDSGQRWTGDVPGCVPDGTVKSQGYRLISSLWLGFLLYLH
ncbi:uncharacterized protein LOC134826805 [Bolinopsis microptera]|uniref:uncharacterized protein LOC134826805 n=1 Tax=Bolinopsis microptera TaxID=2820187 RepID=UPI003078CE88